jgi:hypothetical protein
LFARVGKKMQHLAAEELQRRGHYLATRIFRAKDIGRLRRFDLRVRQESAKSTIVAR